MTISVVLADANILFSRTLRDYFLYAAHAGAIEIRWSQQILDEMSRNLRMRLGLEPADTAYLEALMNDFIEYALIDVDPSDVAAVAEIKMDARDRHVLAAALSADADILVTDNIKHFPRSWMVEHGLELLNAGDLLVRLTEQFPDKIRAAHALTLRFSTKSEAEVLITLERIVGPAVVNAVRQVVG